MPGSRPALETQSDMMGSHDWVRCFTTDRLVEPGSACRTRDCLVLVEPGSACRCSSPGGGHAGFLLLSIRRIRSAESTADSFPSI